MVVARNLGDADTRMVERHYGHLAPSYVAELKDGRHAPEFGKNVLQCEGAVMPVDDACKALVKSLTAISRNLASDPVEARAMAVLAVRQFLLEVDATAGAVMVVQSAWSVLADAVIRSDHGNKSGPKPVPLGEVHRLGIAAAAVTGLCDRGWSVAESVKSVSKYAEIGRKELRTLRDNIHRRRANPLVSDAYHDFVGRLADEDEELTPEGVLMQMRIWLQELVC